MKATSSLNHDDVMRVDAAIAHAEQQTSAELVCAVATESGRYDRAESFIGLVAAIVALGLAHLGFDLSTRAADPWSSASLGFPWQVLAITLGFLAGSLVASYWHGLRRLFVRESEMAADVCQAAWQVFGSTRIGATTGRSGVLIYLSLFERRVVVLADQLAATALGEDQLARLRDLAVELLRGQRVADACVAIVNDAAAVLAARLPADSATRTEQLANHVLVFHPRPGSHSIR
jgi:putative membrane protein